MRPERSYLALVHHPVLDRAGRTVTTAVTNLDVHDLARCARTYGLAACFVVTPLPPQRELVARILAHWIRGSGGRRNPERADALSRVRIASSLVEAVAGIATEQGEAPRVVVTSASGAAGVIGEAALGSRVADAPLLLVLGTGSGLASEVLASAWARLAPLAGESDYNHLPVRAAAAIYLDRLFGRSVD